MLRVGGRLFNVDLHFEQVHPFVVPKDNKVTKMIFEYFIKKNFHAVPQALLYTVREQFCPIRGRDFARKVVKNCIICCKNNPKISTEIMGNLPSERVNPTSPYNIAGVDFAGPFHIKLSIKRCRRLIKVYLAVFICFETKTMHFEVLSDLSSAEFITYLKRIFAGRDESVKLFRDNVTNFVRANTELKKLYELLRNSDEKLGLYLLSEQISWKFIPARSQNFGVCGKVE
ncbi:hypothetical protein AVEN_210247-1 [Araneus ventricosus]|uniref:Integrase zinc-binding domain-containing protein n=1 Tax=Araneus ventricosus TaxID=182803 RepID=A0A4Y2FWJ9_ARAVE|nr:hypothetical protein AVEN_210247-1 [Araneus ventricosus]